MPVNGWHNLNRRSENWGYLHFPGTHFAALAVVITATSGFLACFDSHDRAEAVIERLNSGPSGAHLLSSASCDGETVDGHSGIAGLLGGVSAGAAVGVGIGALAAILIPGAGLVILAELFALMTGFGSAGAAVGGLVGAMSADDSVEQTVVYISDALYAGKSLVVVNTTGRFHNSAVLLCQSAGATIRELRGLDTTQFENHDVAMSSAV